MVLDSSLNDLFSSSSNSDIVFDHNLERDNSNLHESSSQLPVEEGTNNYFMMWQLIMISILSLLKMHHYSVLAPLPLVYMTAAVATMVVPIQIRVIIMIQLMMQLMKVSTLTTPLTTIHWLKMCKSRSWQVTISTLRKAKK